MITVVVGKEIEKLKGEFESVINGMNMVGEIPYNVYSELFDVGVDCIQKTYELGRTELKKENAELKELLKELFSELNDLSELSGMSYKEQVEQFLNSEVEK
jgi:cell shape-determining protein MreC